MMNLEMAKQLLQTGMKKAKEKGMLCSIAIVDENGWLVALHRMDGAPIPTAEIARDKAWTAATFRIPSAEVSQLGDPKVSGYGFNVQNWNERLTTIPGGLPIWENNHLIGAMGYAAKPRRRTSSLAKIFSKIFLEKREIWDLRDENPERNMEDDKTLLIKSDNPSKIAFFSTLLNILVAGTKGVFWHGFRVVLPSWLIRSMVSQILLPASWYLWESGYLKESPRHFRGVFTKLKILSPW